MCEIPQDKNESCIYRIQISVNYLISDMCNNSFVIEK